MRILLVGFGVVARSFAELVEQEGVIPAPYLARAHWVALENEDALPPAEVKRRLREAYELIKAKLPKKVRGELGV